MRIERLDKQPEKICSKICSKEVPTVMERMKQVSARFWMK